MRKKNPRKKSNAKKAVIWGASGFALVVADIIRLRGEFEIAGYLDDINPQRKGEKFADSVILGGREELERLLREGIKNIVLGFSDCKGRLRGTALLKPLGFSLLPAIHPNAVIAADARFEDGVMVGAGVVIDPGVRVGEGCVINRGAFIGHGSTLEAYVNISPGVNVGGNIHIGKRTFVGIGSTIVNKLKIGKYVVIGAGSLVLKDLPDNVTAYGSPAKIVRHNGD